MCVCDDENHDFSYDLTRVRTQQQKNPSVNIRFVDTHTHIYMGEKLASSFRFIFYYCDYIASNIYVLKIVVVVIFVT